MRQHWNFYFLNLLGHVQGEDVSMGIWMAAIGPKRYQVSKPEQGWLQGSEEVSEVSLIQPWAESVNAKSSSVVTTVHLI